jgi:hypothetical protein
MVAPFLARRIWARPAFGARLHSCKKCRFRFFEPRLADAENARLYDAYRGPAYQQTRESCEPWYTPDFNANLESPELMEKRRAHVRELFADRFRDGLPEKVLDFGGNRGELVASLIPGARAFVYDVSGIEPLPGVTGLATLSDCTSEKCDLVICSNVLEHVSSPRQTLDEIAQAAGEALVFIEVPIESPFEPITILKRVVQQLWLTIARPDVAFALLRPGFVFQMHEHVNCFSQAAIRELLRGAGWSLESAGTYAIGGIALGPFRWPSLVGWAFARAPVSNAVRSVRSDAAPKPRRIEARALGPASESHSAR